MNRKQLTLVLLNLALLIILFSSTVLANGEDDHSIFPQWTYYGEIVEHTLLIIITFLAIILLIKPSKTEEKKKKLSISLMIIGLATVLLSQFLTDLHHFLIYPFGMWNAIVHHGFLVIGVALMIYSYFVLLNK